MHTDMIVRKTTIRIWTMIGVCSLGLYFTACDNRELPGKEKDPANVGLRFSASISDTPSSRGTHGPDIMTGTAFPVDTHVFGMFITDETGDPVTPGSEDNMKSTLTQGADQEAWAYTDKNDQILSLAKNQGDKVKVAAYYPWITGATATAVPFDLTGDAADWIDLLYLSSPTGEQEVLDDTPIELKFSHAYCWVTVKLSKLTDKNNVIVKAVSLENSYNAVTGIVNKGTINPKTGDIATSTTGSLTVNLTDPVSIPYDQDINETPSEFNFLVPSFMSADTMDDNIVIRVTTLVDSETEVLSFPLVKTNLNADQNLYGFLKGMHNTYNIIYNNSEMILSLSGWQETTIDASTLGGGATGDPVSVELKPAWGMNASKLDESNHIYHTYLGEVAEGNNGNYVTLEVSGDPLLYEGWEPFMKYTEAIYPKLMIARNLAAGGAPVPWRDETTGVLTAKQACAELRDGGYKDWRLPRVSELFFFVYQVPDALRLNTDQLWSATENDADHCYSTNKFASGSIFPVKTLKQENLYVRCVRDYNKPKSTI